MMLGLLSVTVAGFLAVVYGFAAMMLPDVPTASDRDDGTEEAAALPAGMRVTWSVDDE